MKLGSLLGREGQYQLYLKVAPEMFKKRPVIMKVRKAEVKKNETATH